ncbi:MULTISPECIES: rhodanese-like domain-containing protein [Prevotella]|nr:rhodanese-like domain-containing protein [Prevotella brunnea]
MLKQNFIMGKVLTALLALIGLSSCGSSMQVKTENVNVNEFEAIIAKKKVQLVDVRTPEEYTEGHIPGAINIDVLNSTFETISKKQLNKKHMVAVYCRSGKRSAKACSILNKEGYKTTNLLGGFMAWEEKDKRIAK